QAWDYRGICFEVEITAQETYMVWAEEDWFYNLALRKYLYGWPSPKNVFMVDDELARLRAQSSCAAIAKAAGLTPTITWHWAQAGVTKQALQAAIVAARSPGMTPSSINCPAWHKLAEPVKGRHRGERQDCMWKYAVAAKLSSRLEQAKVSASHYYNR